MGNGVRGVQPEDKELVVVPYFKGGRPDRLVMGIWLESDPISEEEETAEW